MIPPGAGTTGGRLRDPQEAMVQLRQQLALHLPGPFYQGDSRGLSVLSISTELTVWCNGRAFVWHEKGRPVSHSAADPVTAAVRLIARLRQLTGQEGGDDRPPPSGANPAGPTDGGPTTGGGPTSGGPTGGPGGRTGPAGA